MTTEFEREKLQTLRTYERGYAEKNQADGRRVR